MRLIHGTALLGFADAFDSAFGDPSTPTPYKLVVPSRIGPVLLPFECPRCATVCTVPGLKKRYDKKRDFHWCPKCQCRFKVDKKGTPLLTSLDAGALAAPSLVDGVIAELAQPEESAFALLGA